MAHDEVPDELVARVQQRVLDGMGLIVLHSGHYSKIFKRLMGTSCDLKWREGDDKERLWVVEPGHPIAEGLGEYIELGDEEMYGERFDIPAPETLVFVSWFTGGEVFRSGCCYTRGRGQDLLLPPRPRERTRPTFNPEVRRVIANAVRWAAPPRDLFLCSARRRRLCRATACARALYLDRFGRVEHSHALGRGIRLRATIYLFSSSLLFADRCVTSLKSSTVALLPYGRSTLPLVHFFGESQTVHVHKTIPGR